jgi:hypothetical protein
MTSERITAFSDGVFAIIITIMVLELKVPHGTDLNALSGLLPIFLTYVLSFIVVGIYWNNHHHMFALTDRINGGVLWANLHLLFWLSLVPFVPVGWAKSLCPTPDGALRRGAVVRGDRLRPGADDNQSGRGVETGGSGGNRSQRLDVSASVCRRDTVGLCQSARI